MFAKAYVQCIQSGLSHAALITSRLIYYVGKLEHFVVAGIWERYL